MPDFEKLYTPDIASIPQFEPSLSELVNPFENYSPQPVISEHPKDSGVSGILNGLRRDLSTPSLAYQMQPISYDPVATRRDRYTQSRYFGELGFDPFSDNEEIYGQRQTWGNTIGNALAGGGRLAWQTYVEGWKGWGNIAEALFTWDSSKLVGSDEELMELHKEQQEIMNKYAIFETEESRNSIFNRQLFGNMLQQGGFALGAIGQFLSEELLTLGMSSAFSGAKLGLNMARMTAAINKADRLKDAVHLGSIWKYDKVMRGVLNGAKKFVPLLDTASDIARYNKAGASAGQLALIGLGGVKRTFAEANMAFTEARMEAAGTYGDLREKLISEYNEKHGRYPTGDAMSRIDEMAANAASENFGINSGILLLSNRLQFDNLFNKFGLNRKILKTYGELGDDVFRVTGKVAAEAGEKTLTKVYDKGLLGAAGKFGEVAADFGKKRAAWEATKSIGKGLFKWEASEGIQELMQESSNTALQDYYYNLYHGNKDYSRAEAFEKAADEQQSVQGVKTFLMGALTGRLLSPITFGMTKAIDRIRISPETREQRRLDKEEAIDLLNQFYGDPNNVLKEEIANFKAQNVAAQDMDMAAQFQDKYVFHNIKDSALAKMIAAAKKTDMLESVLDTIRSYGDHLTEEQFKEAFGMDVKEDNVGDIRQYFNTIANRIEDYSRTWEILQDKYGDLVMPELYQENTPEQFMALAAKKALDDAIEILATNRFKAERAVARAQELKNEVAQNPNIGSSSLSAFNTLGSEQQTDVAIGLLESEIAAYESNPQLDKATRKILKAKKRELEILKDWRENWEVLQSENLRGKKRKAKKALKAFENYINLKNEENNIDTAILSDDVREAYESMVDYVELNKDHKEFVDAYNTLANPVAFVKMHGKMVDAIRDTTETLKNEHVTEATDDEDSADIDPNLLSEMDTTDWTNKPNPFANASQGEDPSLEEYLREKYNTLRSGPGAEQMPPYDIWRKVAAQYFINQYNKQRGKTTTPAGETSGSTQTQASDMPEVSQADLENPDLTQEEIDEYVRQEIGDKLLPSVKIGNHEIAVGDTINDEEVVSITDKMVFLEKSGPQSYADIQKMLKPFNGKNLVKKGTTPTSTPKEGFENGEIENVEDTEFVTINQNVNKLIEEKNEKIYGDSDKVINAGHKINNNSDLYRWTKDPVIDRERTGPNPNYPMVMGTPTINIGTQVTLKADVDMEDYEEYNYLDTGQRIRRTASDYFNPDGTVKKGFEDEFPIAVYTTIGGKEIKLGHLPTLKWIHARKPNGDTLNVLEYITLPDGSTHNNLVEQSEKLRDLRQKLYNKHNENRTFALTAVVDAKSEGKLRTSKTFNKLNKVLDKHARLGIIKNGMVVLNNGQVLNLPKSKVISNFEFSGKEGWPVVLLETPTGRTLISYVSVPKLSKEHQNVIIELWKSFHAVTADPTLPKTSTAFKDVHAVYEAYGNTFEPGEKPDFNVLRGYVNDYITYLSGDRYDPIKEGKSQLNITPSGEIIVWAVEDKDISTDQVFAKDPAELSGKLDAFTHKLSKVHYNVKLSSETAVGINSTERRSFLAYKGGKITVTDPITYNEYIGGILETNIEKGTPVNPKDPDTKYVYFANPVITFEQVEEVDTNLSQSTQTAAPGSAQQESVKDKSVAKADNPLMQAQPVEEGELDLSMDFGDTLFDFGNVEGMDDPDLKSVRTVINSLQDDKTIRKQCK